MILFHGRMSFKLILKCTLLLVMVKMECTGSLCLHLLLFRHSQQQQQAILEAIIDGLERALLLWQDVQKLSVNQIMAFLVYFEVFWSGSFSQIGDVCHQSGDGRRCSSSSEVLVCSCNEKSCHFTWQLWRTVAVSLLTDF